MSNENVFESTLRNYDRNEKRNNIRTLMEMTERFKFHVAARSSSYAIKITFRQDRNGGYSRPCVLSGHGGISDSLC